MMERHAIFMNNELTQLSQLSTFLFFIGCYVDHDELVARAYVNRFENIQGSNHLLDTKWSNGAVGGIRG